MQNSQPIQPLVTHTGTAPETLTPSVVIQPTPHYEQQTNSVLAYLVMQQEAQRKAEERRRRLRKCAILDGIDLCCGWFPGVGQVLDLVVVFTLCSMYGPRGLWALVEMLDITGVLAAFIPTCSFIARMCEEKIDVA